MRRFAANTGSQARILISLLVSSPIVVVFILALLPLRVQAGAPQNLAPGQRLDVEIAADARNEYRLDLPAGSAVSLSLTQTSDLLRLDWLEDSLRAEARPAAGRESTLHLTLTAESAATLGFAIAAAEAAHAARYTLVLGKRVPLTPALRRRAAAEAQLADAEVLRRAGDKTATAKARALYVSARHDLAALGDGCNLRAAALGQARLEYAAGDYIAARNAASAAVQATCREDRADLAKSHHLAGVANATLGDFAASAIEEERALALVQAINDPVNEAIGLGNLGTVYRVLGENGKALAAGNAALALAQKIGDRERIAYVRDSLAGLYLVRGQLASALAAHRQTLEDLKGLNFPLVEGNARLNLGITLYRLGDHAEALNAWREAEASCRASDDVPCLARIEDSRGDLQQDEARCDEAMQSYGRALALAQSRQLQREAADAQRGLGSCAAERGGFDEAQQHLDAAVAGFREIGAGEEVYALLSRGDLESHRQQPEAARSTYEAALALAVKHQARGAEVLALASLARLDDEAGKLPAARRSIETALRLIEAERTRIDDPALRTRYFGSARSYYALYIDILMQLDQREPQHGHAEAALQAAERARARTLTDQLAQRQLLTDSVVPVALRSARDATEDHLHALGYAQSRLPASASPAERMKLQGEVDRSSRALDAIRGQIRAAAPHYAEAVDPLPLSIADLRRRSLDADTALLEYWFGDRQSYLWMVTRDGLKSVRLPSRKTLEDDIESLRKRLATPVQLAPGMGLPELARREAADLDLTRTMAATLAGKLLVPADALPQRRRVIVTDGALQRLPFAVLDQPGAVPDGARTGVHEAAAHDYVYLPSMQTLRWLRAGTLVVPGEQGRATRIAILADPVFAPDDPRLARPATHEEVALHQSVGRAAQAAGLATLPRLQHSRAEAQGLAALMPPERSMLQLDFAASRDAALKTDWTAFRIVHFATHALLDLDTPEQSGIVLSLYDAQGQPQDGFLRVNDIYRLNMPADLVVLSACESALGKSSGSEGSFNLARAFFYAGARRVLASLWTVDDRASAEFMKYFYRALLKDGLGADEALRAAQAALASDPRWAAPYYWSGYVLQGDWRTASR